MDGRTTNVPSGASNKRRPVPTTQGRKELKIKNNADIADKLENFTGRDGYQVVVNYGMAKFIHNTEKDRKNAEGAAGNGSNSASELGPIAQINTGMLVGALRENNVATLIVRDEQEKEQEQETTETSKEDRE